MWTFTEFQMNLRLMFLARNRGKYANFMWSNHKKDENKQFKPSFVLKGFAKWSPVTGNSHDAKPEIKPPQSPWEKKQQEYLPLCSYFPLNVPKWQFCYSVFYASFSEIVNGNSDLHQTSTLPLRDYVEALGLYFFDCILAILMCKRNPHRRLFWNWVFVFGKYKFKVENSNSTDQCSHNQYSWS